MINKFDKVKIVKLNKGSVRSLIGREGIVLGIDKNCIYKYRVDLGNMVYGFQEDEVMRVEDGEEASITIRDIAINIAELVEKKNHDYNNSFDKTLMEYGPTAYFLRIEDKLSRLKSLVNKEAEVEESIEDTLKDIVGYTLLMLNNKLKK